MDLVSDVGRSVGGEGEAPFGVVVIDAHRDGADHAVRSQRDHAEGIFGEVGEAIGIRVVIGIGGKGVGGQPGGEIIYGIQTGGGAAVGGGGSPERLFVPQLAVGGV